jgi:hypothetical protein
MDYYTHCLLWSINGFKFLEYLMLIFFAVFNIYCVEIVYVYCMIDLAMTLHYIILIHRLAFSAQACENMFSRKRRRARA